ncbi:hypothetical protein GCM10020254_80550 [Streptomyces goshikiensis]
MKKTTAVITATGAILLGAAGIASADAGAQGAAIGSPGVASGNLVQVPVHVPVNVCGNAVSIVGLLNPAFGNTLRQRLIRPQQRTGGPCRFPRVTRERGPRIPPRSAALTRVSTPPPRYDRPPSVLRDLPDVPDLWRASDSTADAPSGVGDLFHQYEGGGLGRGRRRFRRRGRWYA